MILIPGMTQTGEDIVAMDIVLGVTSFFTIAIGGLAVGCLFGLVTALITKFSKVRYNVLATQDHLLVSGGEGGGVSCHSESRLHRLHDS